MPIDGKIRVSEVCDSWKEQWYIDWLLRVGKREANKISKHAMKIGSRVDEIIKYDWEGATAKPKDMEEVKMAIEGFNKWKAVYKPNTIEPMKRIDATVNSIRVTGEPDILVDDEVLVDIKCSRSISPKYWMQVNAYNLLLSLNDIAPYNKVGILRLDKQLGSFEYIVQSYSTVWVECWCNLLNLYMTFNHRENYDGDEL